MFVVVVIADVEAFAFEILMFFMSAVTALDFTFCLYLIEVPYKLR